MNASCDQPQTAEEPDSPAARRTRIDLAHVSVEPESDEAPVADRAQGNREEPLGQALLEVADEPTPSLLAAVAGQTLDSRREQLQLQVSQLAGHLRERLREVDRREAAVNARASQLEADLRASRLWLRERENEFQEREQDLERQIEELQEKFVLNAQNESSGGEGAVGERAVGNALRGVPSATAGDDFETRQQELAQREHQLQLKETDLRERRFEHDRQSAALRHAQQLWEHQRSRETHELALERTRLETEFHERTAALEAELRSSEQLLTQHAAQVDRDRAELIADRRAWEELKSRQRQELECQRELAAAELADHNQRLDGRQEWVERQKAGLEQVRSEILGLHRQSLEMRLIAEQLWSQITGRLTPAEVTQAIAHLRLKLAEQYKLEEQNLDAKRSELLSLGERVASQHAELRTLQTGLRDWNAARQSEIEQQAAALARRELALDAEAEEHRQAQHAWQADRRRFEQQIRDLSGQLRVQSGA